VLRPIRNDKEYAVVLAELSAFVDKEPRRGSKETDRFELLLMLVEAYEAKYYSIDRPDPIEAIKFRMEQTGLKTKDGLETTFSAG
jgi:HTH-type transcriptional regulator/antitoxin HigA